MLPCTLPPEVADALNRESGRIYSQVLVEHYRIYRKKGIWLSAASAEKLNDCYNRQGTPLLHSHSIDAAQQGFYKACKTTHANRNDGAKYPRRRKYYRTTTWKHSGIRRDGDDLLLALARGRAGVRIRLPEALRTLPDTSFRTVDLVYNRARRGYAWHLAIEDGRLQRRRHKGSPPLIWVKFIPRP